MTTSAPRTALAGVSARVAPADTRSSSRPGVRFHTVRSWPASRSLAAIAPAHRAEAQDGDPAHDDTTATTSTSMTASGTTSATTWTAVLAGGSEVRYSRADLAHSGEVFERRDVCLDLHDVRERRSVRLEDRLEFSNTCRSALGRSLGPTSVAPDVDRDLSRRRRSRSRRRSPREPHASRSRRGRTVSGFERVVCTGGLPSGPVESGTLSSREIVATMRPPNIDPPAYERHRCPSSRLHHLSSHPTSHRQDGRPGREDSSGNDPRCGCASPSGCELDRRRVGPPVARGQVAELALGLRPTMNTGMALPSTNESPM